MVLFHVLFVLKNSLYDEILVDDEDIAKASLTSPAQAFDVLLFDSLPAAHLRDQWVQIGILQVLPCFILEAVIELEILKI